MEPEKELVENDIVCKGPLLRCYVALAECTSTHQLPLEIPQIQQSNRDHKAPKRSIWGGVGKCGPCRGSVTGKKPELHKPLSYYSGPSNGPESRSCLCT